MPTEVSASQLGPENPETAAARQIVVKSQVRVDRDERRPDGLHILEGQVQGKGIELLLDADGRMLRGKCTCSHHFKGGLRRGPCRHLQSLRTVALGSIAQPNLERWYEVLSKE
jgi:hypothetical protein